MHKQKVFTNLVKLRPKTARLATSLFLFPQQSARCLRTRSHISSLAHCNARFLSPLYLPDVCLEKRYDTHAPSTTKTKTRRRAFTRFRCNGPFKSMFHHNWALFNITFSATEMLWHFVCLFTIAIASVFKISWVLSCPATSVLRACGESAVYPWEICG